MITAHIHLLINHLPIFGVLLGAIVLGHGLWAKSASTKIAAYNLLIIATVGTLIAYFTGEAAEEIVENIPGIVKASIETHAEFGILSLIAMTILGTAAALGIWIEYKNPILSQTYIYLVFVIMVICFALVVQTASLGGQIRHTELNQY